MFSVLLVESDFRVITVLKEFFEKEFEATFESFPTAKEAIAFLETNERELILARDQINEIPMANQMLNHIYDQGKNIPVITLGPVEFAGKKIISLPSKFKLDDLKKKVIEQLEIDKSKLDAIKLPDFLPFPISNFYLMNVSSCDVYIRIKKKNAEDQYVKRIHANDSFDKEAIKKYESNGLEELYIPKESRNTFLDELLDQSLKKIEEAGNSLDQIIEYTGDSYEIGRDFLKNMGVTEHSIKMAEGTIKQMVNSVMNTKSTGDLQNLLKNVLQNKNSYAFKHSYLIAIFCSGVVPKMDWGSKSQLNIEKMTFVAYFHDALLNSDEMVKINSKLALHKAELTESEKELVLQHANRASTLVQSFPKTPPDVDIIIRQHHGMTNGIGFAEAPSANLSGMAIAFIVIERFVEEILNFDKEKNTLRGIFDRLEAYFTIPSYRKVLEAVKESLTGR